MTYLRTVSVISLASDRHRDDRFDHHDGHPDPKPPPRFLRFRSPKSSRFSRNSIFSSFINAAYEQGMAGLLNSQLVQ